MTHLPRTWRRLFWGFLVPLIPLGGSGWALISFQPDDGNVRYVNDSHPPAARGTYVSNALVTGDFNGDHAKDVVLSMDPDGGRRTLAVFLGPFSADGTFSAEGKFSIQYGVSSEDPWTPQWAPTLALADLTGDGRADLIIGRKDSATGFSQVDIVFGKENPSGVLDLDSQLPDCRITGVSQVAAGDFDGDGHPDLLMCQPGTAVCYLGLGGKGIFSGVIALPGPSPFHRVQLPSNLYSLMAGDFNGDKKSDFIFSPLVDGTVNGYANEVDILFGRAGLPPTPAADPLPVQLRIRGNPGKNILAMGAGDLTGDGRDELIIQEKNNSTQGTYWALDGVDIDMRTADLQQSALPFHSLCQGAISYTSTIRLAVADFDGDGAADFLPALQNDRRTGFLTSQISPGGFTLSPLGSPSLEWTGFYQERIAADDLNGDGLGDIVVYEDYQSIYPPYGALRVLYGFHPLDHPSLRIRSNDSGSPRVSLDLSVGGQPVSMSLSGDIQDSFKDAWIPFRPVQEVVLTPSQGTKTVSAVFKNAVGRISDAVSASTRIEVQNASLYSDTNRIRTGGEAIFDCHVAVAGRLRARIFGPEGTALWEKDFGSVDPGVYPLRWDGRNGNGRRVARGVYRLVLEANGQKIQKDILVE